MDNQEQVYDLISNSEGLSKNEIKKKLKIKNDSLDKHLESLYKYGFIDWERGRYSAVPEDKIPELYFERNIDLHYLKESVDMSIVESIWNKEYGNIIKEIKPAPVKDSDWKIVDLERKMKILESLYRSYKELRRIK